MYIIHQGDGYILCELCHKFALAPDYHRSLLGTFVCRKARRGMKPDIDIFLWPVQVEVEFLKKRSSSNHSSRVPDELYH